MSPVEVHIEGDIAFVTIDNPPVNALSAPVRKALFDVIENIETMEHVRAGVLLCKGKTFVAGADIREFGKPLIKPILPDIITVLESSNKIWLAGLHGTVLGGGLELVLGCSYRIALESTRFGFPEVNLGIIPGAGGTQRAPRLIGLENALDLVTSGKPISAQAAQAQGLIDAIIEGDLRTAAKEYLADKQIRRNDTQPIISFEKAALEQKMKALPQKARGQVSIIAGAHAVMLTTVLPLDEGLREERKMFEEMASSDQSRALRYHFFAEREVAKISEFENVAPLPFQKIGVVGAGTMGCGIAANALLSGLDVIVIEKDAEARAKAQSRLNDILNEAVRRGQLSQNKFEAPKGKDLFFESFDNLKDRDLVIEAVFEDAQVKKDVLAHIGQSVSDQTLIATNTSYLDLDDLAQASGRPHLFMGLHFFAPAHVMKLLEIVRGKETSLQTLATGFVLAKALKKTAVLSGNAEGFIGNRIWQAYRREIEYLVEDGASPYEIDAAMEAFGFPMGPFKVADLSGLDIAWAQRKRRTATRPVSERYVDIPDALCEAGRFGKKTNAGWYVYFEGKAQPDPAVLGVIESARQRKKIAPQKFSAEDIQKRVQNIIVSTGKKLLEESVALRPLDIDVAMVAGYGYPRWRGGPMFEAGLSGTK
ncbi:MAG: 3-hydroxyacyl-CoA dehydrogenase NAD-binding domain-containing protein [Pseudomonadota bacterium]